MMISIEYLAGNPAAFRDDEPVEDKKENRPIFYKDDLIE